MSDNPRSNAILILLGIAAGAGFAMAGIGVSSVLASDLPAVDAVTEPIGWLGGALPQNLIGSGGMVVAFACLGWALRSIFAVKLPLWVRVPLLMLSVLVSFGAAVAVVMLSCWIGGVPMDAMGR